jgi:NTP pyrophosphatase (non-canonical NTP hydrolase)
MNQKDFDKLIQELPPTPREMYPAFVALDNERGVAAPDLKRPVPGTSWEGRAGGLTKEIDAMRQRGLLRKVGERRSANGQKSLAFRVTRPDEVEAAREAFKHEGSGLGKHRHHRLLDPLDPVRELRARLREYKSYEEPSFTAYWKTRRRITDITLLLVELSVEVFWDTTEEEGDLDRAREEFETLLFVADRALDAIDQRQEELRLEGKLEKMENTTGREGGDLTAVHAGRRRLRKRLKQLQAERVINPL